MLRVLIFLFCFAWAIPVNSQTPHKTNHQNGGSDEVDVAGLSGVLADGQNADNIGGIPISIAGVEDEDFLVYKTAQWIRSGLAATIGKIGQIYYTANVLEDVAVAAGALVQGPGSPPDRVLIWGDDALVWCFDKNVDEQMFFTMEVPHSYKPDSDLHIHLHWGAADTGGGNVKWVIRYRWANSATAFQGATIEGIIIDAASGAAYENDITSMDTLTGTGMHESAIITGRVIRDANDAINDTYDDDACLWAIDAHFRVEKPGEIYP